MLLLTDRDVGACLPMPYAVAAMREALTGRAAGQLVSAPRAGMPFGDAGLVWTPGGFRDTGALGLRLYLTGVARQDQIVALWDAATGELRCVALGPTIGRLRTGAIGGVAIDAMARQDASVIGVVGFGAQALHQVDAAIAVRPIRRVQAYRRDREELARLAAECAARWGVEVVRAQGAREAVEGADIVITATSAQTPVIAAGWLRQGAHVNALGPKYRGRQEIGLDLVERAALLACDFPEQYRSEEAFFLHGTPHLDRMQDLAALAGDGPRRGPSDLTLFLSHGLAGSEVRLLEHALREAVRRGIGREVSI